MSDEQKRLSIRETTVRAAVDSCPWDGIDVVVFAGKVASLWSLERGEILGELRRRGILPPDGEDQDSVERSDRSEPAPNPTKYEFLVTWNRQIKCPPGEPTGYAAYTRPRKAPKTSAFAWFKRVLTPGRAGAIRITPAPAVCARELFGQLKT